MPSRSIRTPAKTPLRDGYRIAQDSMRLAKHAKNLYLLGVKPNEILEVVREAIDDVD